MSDTQYYKTVTLSAEHMALLRLAVSSAIGRAVMSQDDAVTLDIADEYAQRERDLRTIYSLLVLSSDVCRSHGGVD